MQKLRKLESEWWLAKPAMVHCRCVNVTGSAQYAVLLAQIAPGLSFPVILQGQGSDFRNRDSLELLTDLRN